MDYHQLISKVLKNMTGCRETYSNSSNHEHRKKAYNEFVDGITTLNKILKGGGFGETSKNKIREILKSSIQQAGEMKTGLSSGNSQSNSNSGGQNSSGRNTGLSNNNSKDIELKGLPVYLYFSDLSEIDYRLSIIVLGVSTLLISTRKL